MPTADRLQYKDMVVFLGNVAHGLSARTLKGYTVGLRTVAANNVHDGFCCAHRWLGCAHRWLVRIQTLSCSATEFDFGRHFFKEI